MIKEIENWYYSNCNGDWEHQFGINIGTLDNPGWSVKIDLEGTKLEECKFEEIKNLDSEFEWIHCTVEKKKFVGHGGSNQLNNLLKIFIDWARLNKAI